MPKTARCKFVVESVKHYDYPGRDITLVTRYDQSIAEDRAFTKATPTGKMEIRVDNPNVFDVFLPGKVVYVDVTPVED